MFSTLKGFRHRPLLPVRPVEILTMTTSDGVELVADLWRPEGNGPWPVLLMRQPYGRRIASTLTYAHPAWYAAHGYQVVIQDVRGTGESGGVFRLFANDIRDGAETVAWAAALPASTGRVGMYGFSYQGNSQLLALAGGAPALKALCPAMIGWTIQDDWAYDGGAFCLAAGMGWALQLATEQARRSGDADAHSALIAAARALPLSEPVPAMPALLRRYAHLTHYDDWLAHPQFDDYWQAITPAGQLANHPLDVPMLHIGGWYDGMLLGTLNGYRAIAARSPAPQHLVIGPWTHFPWSRRVGAVDFGEQAVSVIDYHQIAWFDRFLKDHDNGIDREAPVQLFDLVTKDWHGSATLPAPPPQSWYLASQGLAVATLDDGALLPAPQDAGSDWLVHDPWRPAPSFGGHHGPPNGMQDRAALDGRADIACYTSAPLTAPLTLSGDVVLEIAAEADCPSFDLSATLSLVTPEAQAWVLTLGHARFDGPSDGMLRVPMRALRATVPAGSRLRLSLAGAAFPAYPVNPGTGDGPAKATRISERIITITVRHGSASPSRLLLPVVE